MPVIKSAKKKLRQDKKRTEQNREMKVALKELIKKAQKSKSPAAVKAVFQAADKAVKKHLIHKNKAARIKSRASKLIATEKKAAAPKTAAKSKKTASK